MADYDDIPEIDPDRLELMLRGASQRENRNRRVYSVTIRVRFEADTRPAEWDDAILSVYVRRRAAQVLKAVLEDENRNWFVVVDCEARLLEKRSLFDVELKKKRS